MDSTAVKNVARMAVCTSTVCLESECTSYVYHASMLTRNAEGLPDNELSR